MVLHHVQEVANDLNIPCCGLVSHLTRAGPFKLVVPSSSKKNKKDKESPLNYDDMPLIPPNAKVKSKSKDLNTEPNTASDEALVLFTSGTTGTKKLVPHQIGDHLTAATVIALSWKLVPNM